MARKIGEPRRSTGGKSYYPHLRNRHRRAPRTNILAITKPALRRLARRGGVKRTSNWIYEDVRCILRLFIESVVRDAVQYTEHGYRSTVTQLDVMYALKRRGCMLYGFGM
ncbi:Histone H4.1 [Mycena venus]|uniref:Histone H4 n=1 Tax=Mycena venus TaxID=2733690 RepID=A0A8H6X2P2_9AGAR|nr:Histone H4.1 [Mycena venus]